MDHLLFTLLHAGHHGTTLHVHPFFIGLIASILHVVSGPDHLAAITPLAIANKMRAWLTGLGWGLGHTTGMLLIGLLFYLFRQYIPVEAISHYSEGIVGFMLIGIGLWAFRRVFGKKPGKHSHPHSHITDNGEVFTHIHDHGHESVNVHGHTHQSSRNQSFFPAFLIGTIHGFAGISHLLGVLPTLAFPSNTDSAYYLIAFGIGAVAAMVVFSFLLGYVSHQSNERYKPAISRGIQLAGASLSVVVGFFWLRMMWL
ncbi:MAG TPA: sulfite exporter TauE/SafE family protein [Bacteroidales bacterium]|nr:sulfite exporter TauE/SafE family protein [Bacteroidales bacterium]